MNLKKVWKGAFTNVRHKYRFSVTDENFHEKLSFRLSSLNVWVIVAVFSFFVIAATVAIVVFTPVRQLVPGYVKKEIVEKSIRNSMQLDSLQMRIESQELMLKVLTTTLGGRLPAEDAVIMRDSLKQYGNIIYRRSLQDSLLRKEIENSDRYTVETKTAFLSGYNPETKTFSDNLIFYSPVIGTVSEHFDYQKRHFGIDIEASNNAVIKAVLDGNVVFTSWSPDQGYIMMLEHDNRLLSIYYSASALFKRSGEFVKAGEAIGIVGQSAEHPADCLHFELWYNGTPVDPENYLHL